LFLSADSWRGGVPIEGKQEGEGQAFRGWKGKVFPTCEPRKGHLGRTEAKGQGCSHIEIKNDINSIGYKNIANNTQETPVSKPVS
jgi:hypothetical protein